METPIKPGKYKMRNENPAIVAAVAPSEINQAQSLIGWLKYNDKNWCGGSWAVNGAFHLAFSSPSPFDLISPWIDAPIFNHWDKVPWAKAVYRHADRWYAASCVPVADSCLFVVDGEKDPYAVMAQLEIKDYPAFTGPDKDSLIIRPEDV